MRAGQTSVLFVPVSNFVPQLRLHVDENVALHRCFIDLSRRSTETSYDESKECFPARTGSADR